MIRSKFSSIIPLQERRLQNNMRGIFELLERLSGRVIPRKSDGFDSGLNSKITFSENIRVVLKKKR